MTKADKKFHKVVKEFYDGKLKSSSGKRVRDEKQAIAIAFSEARTIDPKYHVKKYSNGAKIIILDNATQLIFESAYKDYIESKYKEPFDEWLFFTAKGNKYLKRFAEIANSEANLTIEPQLNERGAKISNNSEHGGGKLDGEYHTNGGIRAIIKETKKPVEVENEELIVTKGVAQSKKEFICSGHPEAIVSELNIIHDGDKISDKQATCHLKQEIMERGKKIKSHLENIKTKRIQSMIIRDNELKNKQKMERGAKIEIVPTDIILKINEPKEFEIVKFLTKKDYSFLKIFKTNDICIYIGQPMEIENFSNFLDKYGIHYTEFDNEEELSNWLENQLPKRIQNKLQQ